MKLPAQVLVVVTILSACGSGSPNPSGPSTPQVPQIGGTYTGPTTDTSTTPSQQILTWTIKFSRAGDSRLSFRGCTGAVTIQQAGSTLTGSFTQAQSCPAAAGVLTNGTVGTDGAVTFSLVGPASDPLSWTGFSRCVVIDTRTMDFTGTVRGTLLEASFAHDALIECPTEGFLSVNVRVRGAR